MKNMGKKAIFNDGMGKGSAMTREMRLRRDAVYGTVDWIEQRVSTEVLNKVLVAVDNAYHYGILYNIAEGVKFQVGLEDEI